MAANLATVMANLGAALGTISGLRVYAFPPQSAQPPFAFVAMPEFIDYDLTYGRGADRFTVKIYVGVANVIDRASQALQADYASSNTPNSIKQAVEAYISEGYHGVRVTRAEFGEVHLAGQMYAGVTFTVDVGA